MLRSSFKRRSRFEDGEEVNPLEGTFNLVDAMLVFACGLMVALVANWGVKLTSVSIDSIQHKEVIEDIDKYQQNSQQQLAAGGGFEEMGAVYYDRETGKYYLITDESNGGADAKQ